MSVLSELRNFLPCLSQAEYKAAMYIIEHGAATCCKMNLAEISASADVSEASFLRMCRKVNYDGYTDLRIALAGEAATDDSYHTVNPVAIGINEDTPIDEIPEKVLARSLQAFADCIENGIDTQEFLYALDAIKKADNIYIFASANSYSVANDAMNKFIRIGKKSAAFSDPHIQLMIANNLSFKDVVIGISHSGETVQVVDSIKLAGKNDAVTICITNNRNTPLAQVSRIHLLTAGGECGFDSETMLSRLLQLSIIDMLYLGLICSDYQNSLNFLNEQNNVLKKFKCKSKISNN